MQKCKAPTMRMVKTCCLDQACVGICRQSGVEGTRCTIVGVW
jgi:hypothetical protein